MQFRKYTHDVTGEAGEAGEGGNCRRMNEEKRIKQTIARKKVFPNRQHLNVNT